MENITMVQVMSILAPYAILIFWIIQLGRKQQKLRAEFFKKLSDSETLFGNEHKELRNLLRGYFKNISDSETQRDNLFIDFQKVVIENFYIVDRNSKGQDENWEKIGEIFQEFDSIINEIDKKVNTALDDQEKYSIKRDRYENRLTEVCKAFDSLKVIMNKNTKLTADNFGAVNKVLGSIEINFNKIKNLKEVLENPIEVTRPSCETKLKLKEKVNQNDLESVTEIVNKVDFKHSQSSFKKGDIFVLNKDDLKVYRNKILLYDFHSWTTFGKNVMKKLLQLNEN